MRCGCCNFWTRFGSPTDEYGSGTEEEIEIMLQSGKQVFMYFSDKPISPSEMNSDGYKKYKLFEISMRTEGYILLIHRMKNLERCFLHICRCILAAKR